MSDTSPPDDIYQYAERAQAALLGMIQSVMTEAARDGLAGGHHFYLTFTTRTAGVEMSETLRAAHPIEITIVLQNQFENLEVTEEGFSVTLYFNQQREDIAVPWTALSKFYDPSVAFGLMFDVDETMQDIPLYEEDMPQADLRADEEGGDDGEKPDEGPRGEVVSLDSFRDN